MSERAVHVRIGRLVVDAPLRGEAAHWGTAIERALHAQLTGGPVIEDAGTDRRVAESIAGHLARRIGDAGRVTPAAAAVQGRNRAAVAAVSVRGATVR